MGKTGLKKKDDQRAESLSQQNRWPQFRGAGRDGRVAWLPDRLPTDANDLIWQLTLPSDGVGGLAADGDLIVVSGRDAGDSQDRFVGIHRVSGNQLWVYQYPAQAELDYGNSPRATPVITDGVVVTLGATGILSVIDATVGVPLWTLDLAEQFGIELPTWGFSGSPLVMDETIYVPLAGNSSLAAVDLVSGQVKWKVAGPPAGYASLVHVPDRDWIVSVSEDAYLVRRRSDGAMVWSFVPEFSGDFGVPTPVVVDRGLLFASENNGVQLFDFTSTGLSAKATAQEPYLLPDSHTPVHVGGRLLVAFEGIHCLNLKDDLKTVWTLAESEFGGYASIIASGDRAIVTAENGRQFLCQISDTAAKVLDQRQVAPRRVTVLSHPAVIQDQLVMRVGDTVKCYRLSN